MYIKLSFSAAKTAAQIWRVAADIINTQSITSISALRTREAAVPYASDLLLNLQDSYSYIYRTNNPSNTLAYMFRTTATTSSTTYNLLIRQQVYDSPSTYTYAYIYNTTAASDYILYKPVTLASGDPTISANQWALTAATTQTLAQGTAVTVTDLVAAGTTLNMGSTVYTAHIYVTDYCIMFCFDNAAKSYATNFSSTQLQPMPCLVVGQYKRYDYWNTQANGIFPVVTDTHNGGGMFGSANQWATIMNPISATATECMLKMTHYINAQGGTATTWAVANGARVAHGLGTRYGDMAGLNSHSLGATAGAPNTTNSGAAVFYGNTYNQYRAPLPNLNTKGYTMFPLTFRNLYYCIVGGNITEISGFYIYHGEYNAGDEISYNGKTYVLWSVTGNVPAQSRLAIAVPKE